MLFMNHSGDNVVIEHFPCPTSLIPTTARVQRVVAESQLKGGPGWECPLSVNVEKWPRPPNGALRGGPRRGAGRSTRHCGPWRAVFMQYFRPCASSVY